MLFSEAETNCPAGIQVFFDNFFALIELSNEMNKKQFSASVCMCVCVILGKEKEEFVEEKY